jgi:signal transduction histidine kinase/DNA-binding response OmpR family regulator
MGSLCRKFIAVFACLIILPFCGYCGLAGQARLDSLLQEVHRHKPDTTKINILNELSFGYAEIDQAKGLEYAIEALQLAKQLDWNEGVAAAYNSYAYNYLNKSVFDSALTFNLKALQLYEEAENDRKIAVTLGYVALAYGAQSNFSTSLEYQFRALKKFEQLKDKQMIARTLLRIGGVYSTLGDAKATTYDLDALKRYEELGDKQGIAFCYDDLGNSYYQQGEYERSLDYFLKALKLNRELGSLRHLQLEIGYIGSTYLALGNSPLALAYAFEALKLSEESHDRFGIISSFADVGRAYLGLAKGEYGGALPDSLRGTNRDEFLKRSIIYLDKAKVANDDHSNRQLYYETLKTLSEAYDMRGDHKEALESYKLFSAIKDSIFSDDNKLKIARQETKRESELKEKQIEINKLSKANANTRVVLLLIGIGVLLVVTVVVFRINKRLTTEKKTSDKLRADLQETLEEKTQLVQTLSDSADMKSKFFANISHELRTPVTILTGMLDLMKQKETGADRNKLEIALGNSRRLQMMVEEMLDISKLERSDSVARYQIKDIAPIVRRIAFSLSSYIEQSKIGFSFESVGVEGVLVATDEEKLEKVITNLIYNAIKFNREAGSIKVLVTLSKDKKWVNIVVSDTGAGIDENDLPHIFERYYQSGSDSDKARGMGIGLSLVREFTQLLGGNVSVTSKLGEGTSFTLQYPVFEGAVKETLADLEDVTIPVVDLHFSNPYTILIVEDNAEMRFYFKETLSGNVTLVEMGNGKKALEWLTNNHADLVISDIMMPEMDGREFISILKNDDKLKKTPIIAISALSDQPNQLSLLQLGIDDYIVKPFNPIELRIRVRNLLNNLEERKIYEQHHQAEPDDISGHGMEAAEFKAKLKEYVLARMKKHEVTVYDVAYEFSLGERQLHRLAKSLTGCTPAQLIKEVKLQKAYELAINREVSKVETLAKEVGFENVSYFARQFAERFGKKPSEFL